MADTISPVRRSRLMSKVRSKGNLTTEIAMKRLMRLHGISGWRGQVKILSFRPDFVFRREKVVVFVDGCFWHACPIHGSRPKSNVSFWEAKLENNKARDRRADADLADSGWNVVRFWEHSVRKDPSGCAEKLIAILSRRKN
jgi:DNA mismatch endonuclease, patch repair protein